MYVVCICIYLEAFRVTLWQIWYTGALYINRDFIDESFEILYIDTEFRDLNSVRDRY